MTGTSAPDPTLESSAAGGVEDTSPEARAILIESYRRMSPGEKLQRVIDLNRAVEDLARAWIQEQYGTDLTEREMNLRLAALNVDRQTMIRVFGWNPRVHGW